MSNTNKIIIENIEGDQLRLKAGGEIREIKNQLAELKALLKEQSAQKVQYADKIYNIEHINEASFGFLTGKHSFNELLTKQLIEAIEPHSPDAKVFLSKASQFPEWEQEMRISNKAKEVIAYSFVGVIGIQLSKLFAIGKEALSEEKQQKYIEQCLHIAKRSMDLLCFTLLSALWDASKTQPTALSQEQQKAIQSRFDNAFEPTIEEQFGLLKMLAAIFAQEKSPDYPLPYLDGLTVATQAENQLKQTCHQLQQLNEKLDKSQYDLLDCHEAERQLGQLLQTLHFLAGYRMASIKQIGYLHSRDADPYYLHRYTALGIDSKANVNAEKVNYTPQTVYTDAVLLYQGDHYQHSVNLYPFVIDYNALTFEQGAKICFYRSQSLSDGSLEYLFLEDNSVIQIEKQELPSDDYNQLMMKWEQRKTLNLNGVVDKFKDARICLLPGIPNFDDF